MGRSGPAPAAASITAATAWRRSPQRCPEQTGPVAVTGGHPVPARLAHLRRSIASAQARAIGATPFPPVAERALGGPPPAKASRWDRARQVTAFIGGQSSQSGAYRRPCALGPLHPAGTSEP